ncbi:MAG: OmpA family protein [Pseudomonadales bacterium]|nr:OmpA family protein [Pseudomonadales bacterium]
MNFYRNMIIAGAFSSCTAFSPALMADEHAPETGLYFSGGWNKILMDSERELEDKNDFYAGLGYHYTPQVAVELLFNRADTETRSGPNSDVDYRLFSINAVYRNTPMGETGLFGRLGAGIESISNGSGVNDDDIAAKAGFGVDLHLTDFLFAQAAMDAVYGLENKQADFIPSAGLTLLLASSAPVAEEAYEVEEAEYQDSDQDGVIDSQDQCPDTAPGTAVDANGCPLPAPAPADSDGDGVPDAQDACKDTPKGAKVDERGCRLKLQETVSMHLYVSFEKNSDAVPAAYQAELKKVATFLTQYPDTKVSLEGHTDSTGSATYNQNLSERRATAVMNALIKTYSINPERVSASGKGEAEPIADNKTNEGRAKNRRVTAVISAEVEREL